MSALNHGTSMTPMSLSTTSTDQGQLQAANAGLTDAVNKSTGTLTGSATQAALDQIYSGAHGPGQDTYIDRSNQLVNNSGASPVDVTSSYNNLNPYMQTGAQASQQAASMAGLGPNAMSSEQIQQQYLNNPAVRAQMQSGMQSVNAGMSGQGLLNSGAQMQALNTFGQGVAANTIGAAQDRLAALAGQGASAANQYAAGLLSQAQGNQNAQMAGQQNQTNLMGQQQQFYTNQNQVAQNAASLMNSNSQMAAQQQAAAASQNASALTGGATKNVFGQQESAGVMGGTIGSMNSSLSLH